jgi:hypothetical protein
VRISLLLWDLHKFGWYSGNTHTHYYFDIEESVDERLRMVPQAEAVDVSVISYLIRNEQPFASNRIPIGRLPQFSRDGTILDMGEECRDNSTANSIPFGYGHCLFLNIPRLVQPVSTGMLSPDGKAPDFPTLSMLCAEARRIGGTTVWCHNGNGLEAPVAVALGHVDALNIADGFPVDYDWYYRFLNCGFRLPISTGTDWWVRPNACLSRLAAGYELAGRPARGAHNYLQRPIAAIAGERTRAGFGGQEFQTAECQRASAVPRAIRAARDCRRW